MVSGTLNAQALPGEAPPRVRLRLLNAAREQEVGPIEGANSAAFSQFLPVGYYTVEVSSSSGRGTYQMALASNFLTGGVVAGGYVAPGITGFAGFNLSHRQAVTINVLTGSYGNDASGNVDLVLKDSQGRTVAVTPR